MTEAMFGNGTDQWVCPNDRQLALRAKLHTGWSVHTFSTERQKREQALDEQELDTILRVIRRAEQLDQMEQCRIGRLVERLENMRKSAVGKGLSQCLLCGELLGLLGTPAVSCQDCRKKVCTKCGIEAGGGQRRVEWLCKICSEQREVWKRSGAWFYRAMPRYVHPRSDGERGPEPGLRTTQREGPETGVSVAAGRTYCWARSKVVSSDSDSESELSESSLETRAFPPSSPRMSESSLETGASIPSTEHVLHSKQQDLSASGGRLLQTPPSVSSRELGSFLSESRSSLASECNAFLPAAEDDDTNHSLSDGTSNVSLSVEPSAQSGGEPSLLFEHTNLLYFVSVSRATIIEGGGGGVGALRRGGGGAFS